MIRRPPRSTLFPTRRSSDLHPGAKVVEKVMKKEELRNVDGSDSLHPRSEEHTSELQSPCNLVCRLLLEKKNNLLPIGTFIPGDQRHDFVHRPDFPCEPRP